MDNQSAGGFLSHGNLAEDILDELESDSDEEITDEDKEAKRNLSLGTPDEREDRMYSCVPWPDPDHEVDVRVLKAAVEGDMSVMREMHVLSPKRLKAAHNKYGWTALHLAGFYGNAEMVVEMTSANHFGLPPDKRNKYGWTPVMAAAWGGRGEIVKYLLKDLQCNVNVRDVDGRDLLHACARGGNEDLVKWLVQEFEPPMTLTKNGSDVLIPAAESGNIALFDWLVEKYTLDPLEWSKDMVQQPLHNALMYGKLELAQHIVRKYAADVTSIAQNGATLLSRAVTGGNMEAIAWLTQECNMDIRSLNVVLGWTALHHACLYRHREIVQYFLSLGLDPMTIDKSGLTCLHLSVCEGPVAIVKDLLARNTCRITRVENGFSPVLAASSNGHLEVLKLLEKHNGDLLHTDYAKSNALHFAARGGHLSCVKHLVAKLGNRKFDFNMEAESCLHKAVEGGSLRVVRYLIDSCGLDPKLQNGSNLDCLMMACCHGKGRIVRELIEKHSMNQHCLSEDGKTLLHYAADSGHRDCMKLLVHHYKFDPDKADSEGRTVLHASIRKGDVGMLKFILEQFNPNVEAVEEDGMTPLHYAARENCVAIVRVLAKDYHANMDAIMTFNGLKPLHLAAGKGNMDAMRILIAECGCKADLGDETGRTVLHYTASEGHISTMRTLVKEFKINPDVVDNKGCTPLMAAAEAGEVDSMRVLVKELGCNKDAQDENGYPAIFYALKMGPAMMNIMLTEFQCNPNLFTLSGDTLLHACVILGHSEPLKELVTQYHLNVNQQNYDGDTPLHVATREGHLNTVKQLKALNCDITACNGIGLTAVDLALQDENNAIVEALLA